MKMTGDQKLKVLGTDQSIVQEIDHSCRKEKKEKMKSTKQMEIDKNATVTTQEGEGDKEKSGKKSKNKHKEENVKGKEMTSNVLIDDHAKIRLEKKEKKKREKKDGIFSGCEDEREMKKRKKDHMMLYDKETDEKNEKEDEGDKEEEEQKKGQMDAMKAENEEKEGKKNKEKKTKDDNQGKKSKKEKKDDVSNACENEREMKENDNEAFYEDKKEKKVQKNEDDNGEKKGKKRRKEKNDDGMEASNEEKKEENMEKEKKIQDDNEEKRKEKKRKEKKTQDDNEEKKGKKSKKERKDDNEEKGKKTRDDDEEKKGKNMEKEKKIQDDNEEKRKEKKRKEKKTQDDNEEKKGKKSKKERKDDNEEKKGKKTRDDDEEKKGKKSKKEKKDDVLNDCEDEREVKGKKDDIKANKEEKKKKKRKEKTTQDDGEQKKKGKKVRFSDEVEVYPLADSSSKLKKTEGDGLVQGKRFTKEEDEMIRKAVSDYIEANHLGEEGLDMVLHCKRHSKIRNCWKEIATALPWRPYVSVYLRAHVLYERGDGNWTPEELQLVRESYAKHGSRWKKMADELGKFRVHVKDAYRRSKLIDMKRGHWSQDEYQTLFELVNKDLQMKLHEERKSKHGMLRDNISWDAISDKLSTRINSSCCSKWYQQLTSPMVAQGHWSDVDDYRLVMKLVELDASCEDEVDWENLIEHRSADLSRLRWQQMVRHLGVHGTKSFSEQVEVLSQRYCPNLLEVREALDAKPIVDSS